MSWLTRLFGGGGAPDAGWNIGDEVRAEGESWKVTATVGYTGGASGWRTYKLARGSRTIWVTVAGDDVTRYDSLPDVQVQDGRATWNGRTFERSEHGTLTITDATGHVDGAAGDRAEYETLVCAADDSRWISVERWIGGRTEVSAGRAWRVERVVPGRER